jgi:hypothetical protein
VTLTQLLSQPEIATPGGGFKVAVIELDFHFQTHEAKRDIQLCAH